MLISAIFRAVDELPTTIHLVCRFVMPVISFRRPQRGVALAFIMSTVRTLGSHGRMASAWGIAGLSSSSRRRLPTFHYDLRSLSTITLLTNERVKAILEGIPKASSHPDNTGKILCLPVGDSSFTLHRTKQDIIQIKTVELTSELASRGISTSGNRIPLINRPMKTIDQGDDENVAPNFPPIDPSSLYVLRVKGQTTQTSGGLGVGLAVYAPETNRELWSGRTYMAGDRTLFEAEYTAVISGMEYAHQILGIRRVHLQTSCEIVVRQISGVYKVNKESLRVLLEREREVEKKFDSFSIEEIPSTENALCRDLASKALATRKSFNVLLDENGNLKISDPIKTLARIPTESGRWRQPDPTSVSADVDPSRTYLLRFDGGSRGNPGIAGAGMVIYDDSGQEIWSGWKFYPEAATNNLAEYLGLLCGLKCAKSFGIARLIVEGDSQLIVRQLTGRYQCREPSLKNFFLACQDVAKDFEYFEIRHIPRADNKRADWLANHAMDLRECGGFDQIQGEV